MRNQHAFNYNWLYTNAPTQKSVDFTIDESEFETVMLPHTNAILPYNHFDPSCSEFVSCYRKKFIIEKKDVGLIHTLLFEGVMSQCDVYLNGEWLKSHAGGYTAFAVELNKALRFGENVVAVMCDSRPNPEVPPFGGAIDYQTYGGIYREVTLLVRDRVALNNPRLMSEKVSETHPVLHFFADVVNPDANTGLILNLSVLNNLQVIQSISIPLTDGQDKIDASWEIEMVEMWSLEHPKMYTFSAELVSALTQDTVLIDFGLRDAKFTPDGFSLNGQKIKLRGLNRHQSYPYVGYAMPKRVQAQDADILKYELGVNFVRSSHYPASRHFLNRCDAIGLLVFEELPGWQHIGDEEWQHTALQNIEEMIMHDFMHPSIILWGVRINESPDQHDFYLAANQLARRLDPTRQTGGVRNFANSELLEDVYTYNDFSCNSLTSSLLPVHKVTKANVPYLVTEHNGHMFPTKKTDPESKRLEHALRHARVLTTMMANSRISGAIGWCMADYNTRNDFGSGDNICYHGVLDMFRLPKTAAYLYQSQAEYRPIMEISSEMNIGEWSGAYLQEVAVFTNLDSIKLYKNDVLIGTFEPNTAEYAALDHPPILIRDFIGSQIVDNEHFSVQDSELVKSVLRAFQAKGGKLSLTDSLKMAWIMLKHKMSYPQGVELYNKYVANWGTTSVHYRFEGYKKDQLMLIKKIAPLPAVQLTVIADETELTIGDTYDAVRIVMRIIDVNERIKWLSQETVNVHVSGPAEIIGPKTIALIGGSSAFWIKTTQQAGTINVTVNSDRFGETTLTLNSRKDNN